MTWSQQSTLWKSSGSLKKIWTYPTNNSVFLPVANLEHIPTLTPHDSVSKSFADSFWIQPAAAWFWHSPFSKNSLEHPLQFPEAYFTCFPSKWIAFFSNSVNWTLQLPSKFLTNSFCINLSLSAEPYTVCQSFCLHLYLWYHSWTYHPQTKLIATLYYSPQICFLSNTRTQEEILYILTNKASITSTTFFQFYFNIPLPNRF